VGVFHSLRYRDFRVMWFGAALSNVGTWMMWVALHWHVLKLTESALWVAAIDFANFFPMWLSPFGGVLADRFDRKKILLVTQSVMMLEGLALAILSATGHASAGVVLGLTLIMGLAFSLDAPTRHAFFPSLVPREAMVNAIALNAGQFSLARVIGPAIAGPVIALAGVTPVFWVNAFSFLTVLVALLMVRSPYKGPEPGRPRATLRDGILYAWRHRVVRAMLGAVLVFALFGDAIHVLLPVFADDVFGRGARAYGLLVAAMGIGSVTGALTLGRLGRSSPRLVGLGLTLTGASLIAFAVVGSYVAAFPLIFLFGAGYLFTVSSANGQIQTSVDEAVRGRVVALFMTMFGGVFPLGALAAGAIADRIGAPVTAIAGGVIVLAWGIGLALRSRSTMSVDGTPPPPEKRREGAQVGRGARVTSEAGTRGGRRQQP
jgi:MFS family permease